MYYIRENTTKIW